MSANSDDRRRSKNYESIEIVPVPHSHVARFLLGSTPKPVPKVPEPLPEHTANVILKIIWSWLTPLMFTGFNRCLELNDIYELDDRDKLENTMATYREKTLEYYEKGSHSPHFKAIFYTTRYDVVLGVTLYAISTGGSICMAVLSNKLIVIIERIYKGEHSLYGPAVGYAVGQTALLITYLIMNIWSTFKLSRYQEILRNTIVAAIHDKVLRLSSYGHAQYSTSAITSLITTDTARIATAGRYMLNFLVDLPLLGAVIGLLIYYLGVSALAGVGVIILSLFFTTLSGKYISRFRKLALPHADKRVGTVRETISNMRTLKLYGWEISFVEVITAARKLEEKFMLLIARVNVSITSITSVFPYLAGLLTFAIMSVTGRDLQPAVVFPSLTLFNMVQPLSQDFTQCVVLSSDAYTCFKRIELFFNADESLDAIETTTNAQNSVSLQNASFKWLKDLPQPKQLTILPRLLILLNLKPVPPRESIIDIQHSDGYVGIDRVNLDIKKGELLMIVGPIGSGKSNLLNAIDGHMAKISGSLIVNGKITPVLDSWCLNATVRENVLFGEVYDHNRYDAVIRACELIRDISLFESGDTTEVGEHGITLSGGQKARLSLARGCYADGDIILLDDVLSAVDSKVGKNIMENCITNLLGSKTRIMTTHNPKHLIYADRIVFMSQGKCKVGTLEELKMIPQFIDYMDEGLKMKMENLEESDKDPLEEEVVVDCFPQNEKKLMSDETRARGGISSEVIKTYIQFTGARPIIKCFTIIAFIALMGGLNAMQSIFLNWWSADRFHETKGFYIGIYSAIIAGYCIFQILFLFMISSMIYRATSNLHNAAISNIYRSPLSFFDTNPIGRILNRFTNDLAILDTRWFQLLSRVIPLFSSSLGEFIILFVYVPWSIACLIPLLLVGIVAQIYYRFSSREINRLQSLFRGVQMGYITENIDGCNIILGYGRKDYFQERVYHASDRTIAAAVVNQASIFWFASRVIIAFLPTNFVVVMLCVFHVFNVTPATVGMLLSVLPSACMSFVRVLLIAVETEKSLNSVERLHEYAFDLPQEAPQEIPGSKPDNWPNAGQIMFENVSLRYRENLPLVLNHLDLKIKAGEKIGVCGRTGAGKSSLLACLFRLNEVNEGVITIDGVDILSIGLHQLRRSLSIIPQESVLFKGTVRSNLDPFGEYSDVELWDAIRRSGASFKLDDETEAGGSNFSLGERQLLTLGRALVRQSKVIALDEATANVDHKTDSEIQEVLVREFQTCTVICIAHRLQTILGYDRIVVMDSGKVEEFGTPLELWKKGGIFTSLCREAGINKFVISKARKLKEQRQESYKRGSK